MLLDDTDLGDEFERKPHLAITSGTMMSNSEKASNKRRTREEPEDDESVAVCISLYTLPRTTGSVGIVAQTPKMCAKWLLRDLRQQTRERVDSSAHSTSTPPTRDVVGPTTNLRTRQSGARSRRPEALARVPRGPTTSRASSAPGPRHHCPACAHTPPFFV